MKAEFDRYAKNYERLLRDPIRDRFTGGSSAFFHRRKLLLIEQYFRRQHLHSEEMAWLDVGCGKGELLTLGRDRFKTVRGCDPSAAMAEAAGFDVVLQHSPTSLPFDDKSFDFITAVCIYHHVPPEERVALTRDIRRVLRPGGHFVIIEHNPYNPATRLIVSRTPVDADAQLLSASAARGYMRTASLQPRCTWFFLYLPEKLFDRMPVIEHALNSVPLGGQYAVFGRPE